MNSESVVVVGGTKSREISIVSILSNLNLAAKNATTFSILFKRKNTIPG